MNTNPMDGTANENDTNNRGNLSGDVDRATPFHAQLNGLGSSIGALR